MRHLCRPRQLITWCLTLGVAFGGPALGELSVDEGGLLDGVLFINPEDPSPFPGFWSQIRTHLEAERVLNSDGDTRDDGEPDFTRNRTSGSAEVVWAMNVANIYQVVHSFWTGAAWSSPAPLTSSSDDNLEPRLSVLPSGGLAVAWWRDGATPGVFYAERPGTSGAFGAEIQVTDTGEDARHPSVAVDGNDILVGYEEIGATFRTVVVQKKTGAGSFSVEIIATTSRQDCLAVEVHQDGGKVWVDWIDSDDHMGWSRMTPGGWAAPAFEAYAGTADIERARLEIKGKAIR